MPQSRQKFTPTLTSHNPKLTGDEITLLGEAARSPGEVSTAVEMLVLSPIARHFAIPRLVGTTEHHKIQLLPSRGEIPGRGTQKTPP